MELSQAAFPAFQSLTKDGETFYTIISRRARNRFSSFLDFRIPIPPIPKNPTICLANRDAPLEAFCMGIGKKFILRRFARRLGNKVEDCEGQV